MLSQFLRGLKAFCRVSMTCQSNDSSYWLWKKIGEADPRSDLGKETALVKRITRAETAGLLAKEFPVERARTGPAPKPVLPPDARTHRMKKEISLILELNIQGLGVLADGSFGVDQYITRAGFAAVMADLLVKIAGNPELKQKYARVQSPFQDVRSNNPHFGDIMICHDWAGVMESWQGYFHPMETISGVDALLALRKAEKRLREK